MSALRKKLVDPVFYRLGYLHYTNTIGGVLSGDADTIGASVSGWIVYPADDGAPDGIHVEFHDGVVMDPNDDSDDDDPEEQR